MPHRYFTQEIAENRGVIRGDEAHHLTRVMRAKCGQEIVLCDGKGTDYIAQIQEIQKDCVVLDILSQAPSCTEPDCQITLYIGYPKQDKLEWIIQKAVELGAVRIVPFFSKFCVVQPKKEPEKNSRYQKIAREAAKQSGRGKIPTVEMPLQYTEMLNQLSQYDQTLFCYEMGGNSIRKVLQADVKQIAIITGSEGGFSQQEAEAAKQVGANLVGLGKRILRCETAPIATLAITMALMGELE